MRGAASFCGLAFLLLVHGATGARVHRADQTTEGVEACKAQEDKAKKAACICESVNVPGESDEKVSADCGKRRMDALMTASPWSCALLKDAGTGKGRCFAMYPFRSAGESSPGSGGGGNTGGDSIPVVNADIVPEEKQTGIKDQQEVMDDPLDDTDLELDELDFIDDGNTQASDDFDEEIYEDDFETVDAADLPGAAKGCKTSHTKLDDRANCICSLAMGKAMTSKDVVDRCTILRRQALMLSSPWSCAVLRLEDETHCEPMNPWRAKPQAGSEGGVDVIVRG